jgi:hypothetical protein
LSMFILVKKSAFMDKTSVKITNAKHIDTVIDQPIKVAKTAFRADL